MFFFLSKILYYLVMPLTWILAALFVALFANGEKVRRRALVMAVVMIIFFTNPFLTNGALLLWEHPPTPVSKVQQYDAAIILTGFTYQGKTPKDRIYTNKGADRVLHPLKLYKEGCVKKFIITGGSGSIFRSYSSEASEIRQILLQSCVPAEDILMEEKSRNTHENALYTKAILKQQPRLKKLLLVTSAFHMRRAAACFKKEGIKADVFSTDFYTSDLSLSPDAVIIPQEACLSHWQRLLHEMLGYVVYKLMGYC